jgi:hypothetical protein
MNLSRNIRYILAENHIPHTWLYIGKHYIVVEKLRQPPPPIEVVIKSKFVGTDKHRYVGLDKCVNRHTQQPMVVNEQYCAPYVRFDWRNRNDHPEGDVAIAEELVNDLIEVVDARTLAKKTFTTLVKFYQTLHIELVDMCLFISQDGDKIFSEISQDNARYKYYGGGAEESLDKDAWRTGNSQEDVYSKWEKLQTMVDRAVKKHFGQF